MFRHHLKMAFRALLKNKTFSIINLSGLAVGLAAAIAVLLYVQDELSFERHYPDAERIVRVGAEAQLGDRFYKLGSVPNVVASFIQERVPEVETAVRVFENNFTGMANVRAGNTHFSEKKMYWADSNIMQVFPLQLLSGNTADALTRPRTALLSASAARRFFGAGNPLGQSIRIDNYIDLEITGVFADIPGNTHLPFEILGSFQSINFGKPEALSWGNASFNTYLLLRPDADIAALGQKINALVQKDAPADRIPFAFTLTPLLDNHLRAGYSRTGDNERPGDIRQVRILTGLAAVLLLIACINYMNLATAQAQRRSKEVGLSKTLGARQSHLAAKFYIETALITLLGIGGSMLMLALGLPLFNDLADKNLRADFLYQPWFWAGIGAIWLAVTLVAGAYPALYLSSFSPAGVLQRSAGVPSGGSGWFRKSLVVFQFCISTALIISTLVFYRQLHFIRNKNLGYSPQQTVALKIAGADSRQQVDALEEAVRQLSFVRATARSQTFPGRSGSGRFLGHLNAESGADLTTCRARPDIFKVLDIPLIAGVPMRVPAEGDTISELVINRSAARQLGWTPEQAIGQRIEANLPNAVVTGVCEDFHFGSMHEAIGNYAFHNARTEPNEFLLVKMETGQLTEAMKALEGAFARTMTSSAFDYVFLDAHLDALYRHEQRMAKVALIFAVLAVMIACLGLFALAAFAAERRTKEIGIRKVLGASVAGITAQLSVDFLKLVLLGIVIATPLAWWLMNHWLNDFAYRIALSVWIFVAAAAGATAVALLTVSFQSIRAALANPVKSLRSE